MNFFKETESRFLLLSKWLRRKHTLLKGSSKSHLPVLLKAVDEIDMFIHNSDHTYKMCSGSLRQLGFYKKAEAVNSR